MERDVSAVLPCQSMAEFISFRTFALDYIDGTVTRTTQEDMIKGSWEAIFRVADEV
jgi:hypothetical protein